MATVIVDSVPFHPKKEEEETDVSLEHVASVSTVEKEAKQEISIKQTESFS
jgi:hypothetical protein